MRSTTLPSAPIFSSGGWPAIVAVNVPSGESSR
jgi:hypothetical protein